jgi:hypothetical protein
MKEKERETSSLLLLSFLPKNTEKSDLKVTKKIFCATKKERIFSLNFILQTLLLPLDRDEK